jgi:hypothetical protein
MVLKQMKSLRLSCLLFVLCNLVNLVFSNSLKPSELSIPASIIGEKWNGPKGLVVDTFENLNNSMVKSLKKTVEPLGVIAMADYTYTDKKNVFNTITIRLFVFETKALRKKFCDKKYYSDEAKKLYKESKKIDYIILDSLQVNKRIIIYDKYFITGSQLLTKGNDHTGILQKYLTKIKTFSNIK